MKQRVSRPAHGTEFWPNCVVAQVEFRWPWHWWHVLRLAGIVFSRLQMAFRPPVAPPVFEHSVHVGSVARHVWPSAQLRVMPVFSTCRMMQSELVRSAPVAPRGLQLTGVRLDGLKMQFRSVAELQAMHWSWAVGFFVVGICTQSLVWWYRGIGRICVTVFIFFYRNPLSRSVADDRRLCTISHVTANAIELTLNAHKRNGQQGQADDQHLSSSHFDDYSLLYFIHEMWRGDFDVILYRPAVD